MALGGHVIVVIGPEVHTTYFSFARTMDKIIGRLCKEDITIVSAIAPGTDYLTLVYALRRGLRHVQYAPDKYEGDAATYRMHERMLGEATHAVVFKSGYDKHIWAATKNAERLHVPSRIIDIAPELQNAEKSQKGYRRLREASVRTLSRYRKRRVDSEIPKWND